jgi:hypothetical protein
MMNNNIHHIIGLDFGAGAVKFAGDAGEGHLLSQVSAADPRRKRVVNLDPTGLLKARTPDFLRADFGAFYVGPGAHEHGRPVEGLDPDRFSAGKIDTRALFCAAVAKYMADGAAPGPLTIAVGLPLEPMLGDNAAANKAAVEGWMRGQHRFAFAPEGGRERELDVHVERVLVTSQAAAALFYLALDDHGGVADGELLAAEVGVVSVGFATMELFAVSGKSPVRNLCASSPVGVQRLLTLADPERAYTLGELDGRLRRGALDVSATLPIWAREVEGEIRRIWGRAAKRFSRVIAVGGGALLLRRTLESAFSPYLVFPDDPIMAVARGLRKIARGKYAKT